MGEATAMKIIEQTSSSRNISTDIHATDVGVTAPAVAKTGKGIFARVFYAITESQMKRTEREGRVFLDGSSTQSQNRR
jgi:predicted ATPase